MKQNLAALSIFAVVALAQLAVPASMIIGRERTLSQGTAFRFRTAPVDPYDAFRGRYVRLQLEQNQVPAPPGKELARGQKVFAILETGADGFARFKELRRQRPDDEPYLTVRVNYPSGATVQLQPPFDRFYMEESLAPEAEQAYREHSRRGQQNAFVQVRIRAGDGVIENLYIDDKPITDFVKAARRSQLNGRQ